MITKTVKFQNLKKRVEICEDFDEFLESLDFDLLEFFPDLDTIESLEKYLDTRNNEDYGPSGNPVAKFIDFLEDDFAFSMEFAKSTDITSDENCAFSDYTRFYIEDEHGTVFVVNVENE